MLRWFVVVTAACAFVVAGSTNGGAHSNQGLIEAEAQAGEEPRSVEVRARLVYANDREPVSNASVMLHGVSPSGAALPMQLLASEGDGVYAGAVVLPEPGQWKLQVMSEVPTALVDLEFDAAETATTTPTTTLPEATTVRCRHRSVLRAATTATTSSRLRLSLRG